MVFNMLQVGHYNNADDDEQEPGAKLAKVHKVPMPLLVGVLPGAQERGDVLGQPDKTTYEEERKDDVHFISNSAGYKRYIGFPEDDE